MHGVMTEVTQTPEITPSARTAFASMLRELRVPEGYCMRLNLKGGGLFLGLDQAGVLDETIEHEGRVVLTIDEDTCANCKGLVLDYDENERFILRQSKQPNRGSRFPENWPPEFVHPEFRKE